MLVEIDLDNADGRIRPGYYGQTRIVLEWREGALALPASAVHLDGETPYVYVVGPADVARRATVGIGVERGGWIEITSGLAADARVIASAAGALADGTELLLQ